MPKTGENAPTGLVHDADISLPTICKRSHINLLFARFHDERLHDTMIVMSFSFKRLQHHNNYHLQNTT